jgi:ribosome recycling factor
MVNRRIEEAKVALRNIRRDALEDLREFESERLISEDEFYRTREDLQDLIDRYTEMVEEIGERKAKEIREV